MTDNPGSWGCLWLFAVLLIGCAEGTGPGANDNGNNQNADPDGAVTLCGNGVADPGEDCDGADLADKTCAGLGFEGGTLACSAECSFDTRGCETSTCGNGALDTGEACDGNLLGGASCASLGYASGTLRCAADCTLDTSECESCGNGVAEPGEDCDGPDLGSATCADLGYSGGALACDSQCAYDTSGCVNENCGNGVREGSEDCDGVDLGGAVCANLGYWAGTLACAPTCTFDTSGCTNCGNGQVDGTEACDGADLGGQTCNGLGYTAGTLSCATDCTFNTSGCYTQACGNGNLEAGEGCDDGNVLAGDGCGANCQVESGWSCQGAPSQCDPVCGDGQVVGGEACDGGNLNGETCIGLGYSGGTLACTASCTLDTSGCTTTTCGNGVIDLGETCDDGNTDPFDGCDAACQVETSLYLPVRLRNGDGSNHGMVEVYYSGAWHDVCDDIYDAAEQQAFADVVCRQLGYTGTGHQFLLSYGGGSGQPIMDDVSCTGTEEHLGQCDFRGWGVENCGASEAVGVRCSPGEGDIRLVDGPSGMEGRLQIYHNGAWGEVCDDYIDGTYTTATPYGPVTVCQQLGYKDGVFVGTYNAPNDTFVLDDVNCTGTERRIADCPHAAWGTENCWSGEAAGFRCEIYGEGDVRLVEGSSRASGRVEILHNSVWGTVCDDYIQIAGDDQTHFIEVVCAQLGFTPAGSVLLTTSVPDGVDPIWMDDVRCAGTETSLASCPFRGWQLENCSHYEDVGLTCTP